MTQNQDATLIQPKTDPTQEPPKKGGLIAFASMPTVLAAACAIVTAFLLSSRLGLVGSLIGAVLVTAVATLATKVYGSMISRSIDQFDDISYREPEEDEERQDTVEMYRLDRTEVRPLVVDLHEDEAVPVSTPMDASTYHEQLERRKTATAIRRTFVVAVVAALVALGVYVALVIAATGGKGIGPSLDQVVSSTSAKQEPDTTAEETETDVDADATSENEAEASSNTQQYNGGTPESSESAAVEEVSGQPTDSGSMATEGEVVDTTPVEPIVDAGTEEQPVEDTASDVSAPSTEEESSVD